MSTSTGDDTPLPAPIRVGEGFADAFPAGSAAATEAVLNIVRAATLLTARVAPLTRAHHLSLAGFSVLEALSAAQTPLSPRTISQRLVVPAQTLTSVLDGLERVALVERRAHPHDRRSILIAITGEGIRTLHETCVPVVQAEHQWMACLSPAEQETLICLLGRVQQQLQSETP
jgi:DNA-binding MarR family transcriptional regulator